MRLMELSLDDKEHSPEARLVDAALDQLRDPVRRYEHGLCGLQLTPEQGEQFRRIPCSATRLISPTTSRTICFR